MKITSTLIEANVPTVNGRIYPDDILKQMVSESKELMKTKKFFGTYGNNESDMLNLDNITHQIIDIDLINGKVIATAELLNTSASKNLLIQLDKHSYDFTMRTSGIGTLEGNVVKDFKLTSINIYDKKNCM
jgi:hypothetical protein